VSGLATPSGLSFDGRAQPRDGFRPAINGAKAPFLRLLSRSVYLFSFLFLSYLMRLHPLPPVLPVPPRCSSTQLAPSPLILLRILFRGFSDNFFSPLPILWTYRLGLALSPFLFPPFSSKPQGGPCGAVLLFGRRRINASPSTSPPGSFFQSPRKG